MIGQERAQSATAFGIAYRPQAVAVTGSVNQQGEIQAVGAINEKIEGFFDVCRTPSKERRAP